MTVYIGTVRKFMYMKWILVRFFVRSSERKRKRTGHTCFRITVAIYMTVTSHTVWTRDNMEYFYRALIHLLIKN